MKRLGLYDQYIPALIMDQLTVVHHYRQTFCQHVLVAIAYKPKLLGNVSTDTIHTCMPEPEYVLD